MVSGLRLGGLGGFIRHGGQRHLARSLVATVHGHCVFALYNTFSLLGETDPRGAALARVREAIAAAAA